MRNINQITITGNLTEDPKTYQAQSGDTCLNLRMAVNRSRYNKDRNEWEDLNVTYWSVSLWDRNANELAATYRKGQKVQVTGSAEVRTYEHNGQKRYDPTILATTVTLVPKPQQAPQGGGYQQPQQQNWGQPAQVGQQQQQSQGSDPWNQGGNAGQAPF